MEVTKTNQLIQTRSVATVWFTVGTEVTWMASHNPDVSSDCIYHTVPS